MVDSSGVFAQAEATYRSLAVAREADGRRAVAGLIIDYAELLAENAAFHAAPDIFPSPRIFLPTRSLNFQPAYIAENSDTVLLDMYMTLIEVTSPGYANSVLAQSLRVDPGEVAAACQQFSDRFVIGAISPLDRMRGMVRYLRGTAASDDELHHLMQVEFEADLAATSMYPGVEPMIASYRGHGCKVGIVSNATPWGIEIARHYDLIDMVDAAGFSADPDIGEPKPFPRIYERTCARLGVAFSSCIFVDDGGTDLALEGAQLLGMRTLRVDHPGVGRYRPVAALADYVTSRIGDIALP
jgi:HAD superfamily hydrolase (TIGR01509 family)